MKTKTRKMIKKQHYFNECYLAIIRNKLPLPEISNP